MPIYQCISPEGLLDEGDQLPGYLARRIRGGEPQHGASVMSLRSGVSLSVKSICF
jgi:hypothetical protein